MSRVKIYRHKTSDHKIVAVGLELYSDHEVPSESNYVLGFRSLWTEHAKDVVFSGDEKITGVSFERNDRTIQVALTPSSNLLSSPFFLRQHSKNPTR